jgi:RNA polymerase sigma-70 factor (ECF subfamily)
MSIHDHSSTASPGTDDLLPTRRSLLVRLKDWRDDRSWQEFFDSYWRLIYNVALKAGLTPGEAQEVVQETVLSVAKKMKEFQYDPARGSFKGWLLQLTGWRITNQFNRRPGARPGPPLTPAKAGSDADAPIPAADVPVPPELERLWEDEWQQNLLHSALERVRRRSNPKDFQIFDLSVVKQKPLKEIRRFLAVSAMQVYLARHRVGRLVRKEIARLSDRLL